MKFVILLKGNLLFNTFYCLFCLYTNPLRLYNLKTNKAMNAKRSGFVIYVKGIIYLLLYNLNECTPLPHPPNKNNDQKW